MRPRNIQTGDAAARRSCLGKNAYSKRVAIRVARKVRRRTGHNVRHYACLHCGLFHVGHVPGAPLG